VKTVLILVGVHILVIAIVLITRTPALPNKAKVAPEATATNYTSSVEEPPQSPSVSDVQSSAPATTPTTSIKPQIVEGIPGLKIVESAGRKWITSTPQMSSSAAASDVGRNDPMARWTSHATGYTWITASEVEKRALVERLAFSSRRGNSANFFYDALNAVYSEPQTRSEKLGPVCDLIDAGGTALPLNQRNY
jgi:hypothetical protein